MGTVLNNTIAMPDILCSGIEEKEDKKKEDYNTRKNTHKQLWIQINNKDYGSYIVSVSMAFTDNCEQSPHNAP